MRIVKVAYICDQKRDCGRFEKCQKECFYTSDTFHTAYGVIHNIKDLDTDRFIKLGTVNETEYYMEARKNDEEDTLDEGSN